MIHKLQLLRNIGQFDSVSTSFALSRLTLIYAENGRGKTTLAAILRSLATGDPLPIVERRRLSATNPPHIVCECSGGPRPAIFDAGAWNRTLPNLVVFDDVFIDENVYSGLAVAPAHRQQLHGLVLGAQGVALSRKLAKLVADIETHNTALRPKALAIVPGYRGSYSVDDFCALPNRADIDTAIQEVARKQEAAAAQSPIKSTHPFDALSLPAFDVTAIEALLQIDLATLDTAAAAQVQDHLARLGVGAERWVADGMARVGSGPACPFCAQDLTGSSVIRHYRAYFSDAYRGLKQGVSDYLSRMIRTHDAEAAATFERSVRMASERRQFWARFCEVPAVNLDTAAIVSEWMTAREHVIDALTAKQAAPLERSSLPAPACEAIAAYQRRIDAVNALSNQLVEANARIAAVKTQVEASNPSALAAELGTLKAIKARHSAPAEALCNTYLSEKTAKLHTEQERDRVKTELDAYRATALPRWEGAINDFLGKFNAGFKLAGVNYEDTRGGRVCNYNIVVAGQAVPVAGGQPAAGEPSFRNVLSAGDRSTLALAFFFATVDLDPSAASKIVILDDPISSLDEHRSLTTVQEIRRLANRVAQVIVLSHSRSFLCDVWRGADASLRGALTVARDTVGSTLTSWDVTGDSITEHDRLHRLLREHVVTPAPQARDVAEGIRPFIEGFLRVAVPEHFPPSGKLGDFRRLCNERVGTPEEILNVAALGEFENIVEYGNAFHHETNPTGWKTAHINDGQLTGFVVRALKFAKRS